ncbi:hypothetical protein HALLA_16695 [Halostagnicola larsenii XH-48]|uniref:DUF7981 domain-containing protein n=1 Tax=Halostagnicola larsenii XH-48 TaxID=797299 RepID=W0JNL0_9EURY|nr:hypothetical protein [Halostagnicola larsenii]AHG00194.1 hypothetical protein HALLA_16695 [Halostagnicola larsenii XH-48]
MHSRRKSALLWGLVGAMAFLAVLQGYTLARGPLLSITRAVLVATVVGGMTALVAYGLEHRIAEWTAKRAEER